MSKKNNIKRKIDKEFSDEQIEKIMEFTHDDIQERLNEIKELVRAYPILSVAAIFTLGLLFGIAVSDN
ncbi:hypothetical protein [[Eubacterium] cellulosolvens]